MNMGSVAGDDNVVRRHGRIRKALDVLWQVSDALQLDDVLDPASHRCIGQREHHLSPETGDLEGRVRSLERVDGITAVVDRNA